MKKILIALLLLGSIFANSFAQEYDVVEVGEEVNTQVNEVYLSVGTISALQLGFDLFATVFSLGTADTNQGSLPVTFTAGYNRYLNDDHLGLGGFITYERMMGTNVITLQGKIIGQYGWEHFKLYHAFGLGAGLLFGNTDTQIIPAFDLTVLGIKFDFENFNIFSDFAIGTSPLVKLGASYKF